ncbi:jg20747 [Pararge aegeria aegeria]|uniref:Jg20747 protein n=1 Tax=Pararge aegeria aegeria TaxID=348720 RepID=A0A8S4S3G5_9NEOP|nr:jg20747 [Pararge aegeria aegeria]
MTDAIASLCFVYQCKKTHWPAPAGNVNNGLNYCRHSSLAPWTDLSSCAEREHSPRMRYDIIYNLPFDDLPDPTSAVVLVGDPGFDPPWIYNFKPSEESHL